MQAVNHVATALILKRGFPKSPLLGLMIATEAVEYLWVGLNLIGVEETTISDPMRSVADVHLIHMPFSHSIVTSTIFAVLIGLFVAWRGGGRYRAAAVAFCIALFSHVVLDLLVHAPDIAVAPFADLGKFGTGLYANLPLSALALEFLWGVLCWRTYRGSRALLVLIAALNFASLPLYSITVNLGERALSGQSAVFALLILVQMILTSVLVWLFTRGDGRNAEKRQAHADKN